MNMISSLVRTTKLVIKLAVASFIVLGLTATFTRAQPRDRGLGISDKQVKVLPAIGKRYAVVIGVDQYADTQITTLGGASNDAKTLANALIQYAGFPSEQVTLLASDQPAERQPTRGNILRRLSNMAAVVPPDGLLLLSFAGHGIERSGQAFLLPADAQVSDDVELLEQTAINVSQIKERIKKIGVTQVLLILDACRNDPVGRANADNPLTPAYTRGFNFDVRNPKAAQQTTAIETGAPVNPNATGRDTGVELKPRDSSTSLAGTTWTGTSPEAGEYTLEFLKEGQLNYILNVHQNGVTSPRTVKGTWKQSGNNIQIVIGNSYSVLHGNLEGNVMKGEGTNQEGVSWKWTLFKKE